MNVCEFITQRRGFFLLFMLTLIVVSFSGIYVLNWMSQDLFDSLATHYYVVFNEPQSLTDIEQKLKESGLSPSSRYFFEEKASSILTFNVKKGSTGKYSVDMNTEYLKNGESPGVYCVLYSKYNKNYNRLYTMLYGRHLTSNDSGENNAVVSHYLDPYITDNKINVGNTEYNVVGCYQNPTTPSVSNIMISPETFVNNGYKVMKAYLIFELVPSEDGIAAFEKMLDAQIAESNSSYIEYFTLSSAIQLIKNCAIFVVMFIFVFISVSSMFYCWINSTGRLYSIYKLCGMTKFQTRMVIIGEMLLYTLVANIIGVSLFYILLATNVMQYVSYPYAAFIPVNYFTMLFFSCIVSFKLEKKSNSSSFLYNI